MPKIAIFASGAGTNAREIINYLTQSQSSVRVELLITNNKNSGLVHIAKREKIPCVIIDNSFHSNGVNTLTILKQHAIQWVILAGFLRKIPLELIRGFSNRIINLHPSLLPKYGGKGMYGKHVHEAVLLNNEIESGITIHIVNEEYDQGAILFQAKCKIESGETITSLALKIQKLEHQYYPIIIE
ncbi:MAG: phosphoribosylglycinamide formyltransferase, partial [Flavobacteriales bacterium]|nr:phosphoribosylglycinamide formyltransferase [Flavobacteriales bacterium]